MIRVEGSTDGLNWILFSTTPIMLEARQRGADCILKTKYTHVRLNKGDD